MTRAAHSLCAQSCTVDCPKPVGVPIIDPHCTPDQKRKQIPYLLPIYQDATRQHFFYLRNRQARNHFVPLFFHSISFPVQVLACAYTMGRLQENKHNDVFQLQLLSLNGRCLGNLEIVITPPVFAQMHYSLRLCHPKYPCPRQLIHHPPPLNFLQRLIY